LALALFPSPHSYTKIEEEEEDEEDVESSQMTQHYLCAINIAGFNLCHSHI
jgi:hypothetical protein